MPGFQVQVKGLNQTVRSLERMGVEAADLKDAFNTISTRVATTAKGMTPADTGRLRAGITASKAKNKAVVRSTMRGRPYNFFVHFGTRKMAARTYLFDAVDAVGEPWIRAQVESGLNVAIARAGLGGGF